MAYDSSNVFSKILKGEIKINKIYKDDFALSFFDISPKAKIHALVIPTGEYENFYDFHTSAPNKDIIGFYDAVKKVIELLELESLGFRLLSNCGINANQEVQHYHVHILGGEKLK